MGVILLQLDPLSLPVNVWSWKRTSDLLTDIVTTVVLTRRGPEARSLSTVFLWTQLLIPLLRLSTELVPGGRSLGSICGGKGLGCPSEDSLSASQCLLFRGH